MMMRMMMRMLQVVSDSDGDNEAGFVKSVANYQKWYAIFPKLGVRVHKRWRNETEGGVIIHAAEVKMANCSRFSFAVYSDECPDESTIRKCLIKRGHYNLDSV